MVTGTTFNWGPDQHHHRMQRLGRGRGESGEIFRMPWKCEAGAIEHGFGDRVGDDGASDALSRQRNGALDRLRAPRAQRLGRDGRQPPGPQPAPAVREGRRERRPALRSHRRAWRPAPRGPAPRRARRATSASPSRTKGGIASRCRACQASSVISGPIPAGSPRVSARGRFGKTHAASASTKRPP